MRMILITILVCGCWSGVRAAEEPKTVADAEAKPRPGQKGDAPKKNGDGPKQGEPRSASEQEEEEAKQAVAEQQNKPAEKKPAGPGKKPSPEQYTAAMTLPEGFSATLFAKEPDVCEPTAFTFDDRGRLWVLECYSHGGAKNKEETTHDRILILEDTDGDGRMDKRTVFKEDLSWAYGLEVGFGGVYVATLPDLLYIPMKDDKPAGDPQVLLTGWDKEHSGHGGVSTLLWGPDGWLYGCSGYHYTMVGAPGTTERLSMTGCVWRFHPTRKTFEIFARGLRNPWGLDYNQYGHFFSTDSVQAHLFYLVPGAKYYAQEGYLRPPNWENNPGLPPCCDHLHYGGGGTHGKDEDNQQAGGGRAHCGLMFYLGGQWPEQYKDTIFISNVLGRRVNNDLPVKLGSSYVGKHGSDFMLTRNGMYVGVSLKYGPDGSVFIIDRWDTQHYGWGPYHKEDGRIYRIAYGEPKPWTGDLQQLKDEELVALLSHENAWFRRHAQRILQERSAKGSAPALAKLVQDAPDSARKLQGLWSLFGVGALTEENARGFLKDKDEYVRAWTFTLLADEKKDFAPETVTAMAAAVESEASPVVHLALASALPRMKLSEDDRFTITEALCRHEITLHDETLPRMLYAAVKCLPKPRILKIITTAKSSLLRQLIAAGR